MNPPASPPTSGLNIPFTSGYHLVKRFQVTIVDFNKLNALSLFAFILILAGCGSGTPESWNVGADGGTREWSEGVTTVVPAGALTENATITVQDGDTDLPEGFTAFGPLFLFGPAGLTFQKPVEVTLPVTAVILPDTDVRFYWTVPGSDEHFVPLRNASCGSADCTASVAHFSLGFVGTEDSCASGDLRCLGDYAQVCGIDGMWSAEPEDCAAEDGCCEDGMCVEERFCGPAQTGPIMCEPNEKSCLGDQWTLICTNENKFRRVADCFAAPDDLICRGGECVPFDDSCWGNETRCIGDVMQECDENGLWRDKTNCANEGKTCVLASCVAENECVKDDVDCQGDVVVTCEGDPAKWVPGVDCSAQGLICRAGSCSRACQDGDKRCAGQVAQSCDFTGKWKSLRDCANSGDECIDGECVDPDWCEKNEKRCDGNLAQSCGAFGIWVTVQDCSVDFNICVEGECVDPGDCVTGEKRCLDDIAQSCDENGQWQTEKDCGDDFEMCFEGECIDSELCTENDRKCLDDLVQICDASLIWQDDENCATNGKICVEGYCEDPPPCQSGDLRCDGDTVQRCNGAGNWIDERDCAIDCLECHLGWCDADETGVCCSSPSIATEPWSLVPPSECDMTKPYLPGADCADMKCCKLNSAYLYDVVPSSWCDYNQPKYERSECANLTCCKRKYQTFLMPASDCTPEGEIMDAAECDYGDRLNHGNLHRQVWGLSERLPLDEIQKVGRRHDPGGKVRIQG